ncbi:MAG: hypothetical protein ABFD86_00005, partial [Bryobacteraceae bacterium]
GYTIFFGSPCDITQDARLFRFAQGQALLDGRQNGWMSLALFKPEHAEKAAYFRQCARYRVAAKKYLTYGRLIAPIESSTSIPQFTNDQFGWNQKHRGTAPLAEGRLWQAEDGKLAVLLANYSDNEIPFTWRVDPAEYGLKGGAYTLASLAPEGTQALGGATGVIQHTEKLGPRQLRVIEIAAR